MGVVLLLYNFVPEKVGEGIPELLEFCRESGVEVITCGSEG
ncbi:MAG: hypothetical protein QXG08_06370 [Candidatus Methanomethyliaceae archaeon]